jgi:hypothetical protein
VINEDLDDCLEEITMIVEGKESVGFDAGLLESIEICREGIARILKRDY